MGDANDERELLAAAGAGQNDAREQLLLQLESNLRAFLRLRCGQLVATRESVSDLVQTVFLEILQEDKVWSEAELEGLRRQLLLRAERKIIDRVRYYGRHKRDARREVPLDPNQSSPDLAAHYQTVCTPSNVLSAREEAERVERAFEKLPDDYRRVILLSRFAGMDVDQVAAELGRTRNATWTLLSRALARLAAILQD